MSKRTPSIYTKPPQVSSAKEKAMPVLENDQEQATQNTHDIITVVRDPERALGKLYRLQEDGTVEKSANVKLSFGIAVQHKVSTEMDY